MMKKKINEGLCGSFAKLRGRTLFRVVVVRLHPYYGMLDAEDPEDWKDIPYQGTDSFHVERAYEVYVLEEADVMTLINEAVETVNDLYRIRVHNLPLSIRMEEGEVLGVRVFHSNGVRVFHSNGEEMGNPAVNRFEPGDIVEYYDSENQKIQLAVVYNIIENSEEEDCDGNHVEYGLLAKEQGMMPNYVQAADVSAPSFPVSETFRKELEELYRKKLEDEENEMLSFTELLDLL